VSSTLGPVTDVGAARDDTPSARALRDATRSALARALPARWMHEHDLLPLGLGADGVVRVAAGGSSERDPALLDQLARRLGAPIALVAVPVAELRAALLGADGTDAERARPVGADRVGGATTELRALAETEPVVQLVEGLLLEGARLGASDVHLESTETGLRVRYRLDGVLQDAQQLAISHQAAVISRVKVLAGLDIAERRVPQDGRTELVFDGRTIDVRVATLPALHGENVVLRLLDQGAGADGTRSLDALGLDAAIGAPLAALARRTSGIVLVTGPTGSGKTTTLYALLAARNTPGVKVVTVEDPVEYQIAGVTQLPVQPKAGFGFATALRAILRHDPDVIMVGEMRDLETAEVAVQAALTGHLVLSTLHTNDAITAITRLVDMGVAPYLVAATVQGVLAQRLVRVVCPSCAREEAPSPAEQRAFGPTVRAVRRAVGCAQCAGTGYRGRQAIAELLVIDEAVRGQIAAGASARALRDAAPRLRTLFDDAVRLVAAGVTTPDELWRVLGDQGALDPAWQG
jgi:type II secretory ATPase GspE/PulE/Tfp pilus assembly ATPase PilB-like protein